MTGLEDKVDPQVWSATFNEQLLVGAGMIAVCVIIHGVGLFTLRRIMHGERARERMKQMEPLSLRGTMFTLFVVFALITLHFIEIWLFALLYDFVGALRSFQEALYVSTADYATLGAGITVSHQWRLVSAIEGLIGFILIGWSTAFFFRVLERLERDVTRN